MGHCSPRVVSRTCAHVLSLSPLPLLVPRGDTRTTLFSARRLSSPPRPFVFLRVVRASRTRPPRKSYVLAPLDRTSLSGS